MDHVFRRWVERAQPYSQLWRTAVGGAIVFIGWFGWTTVFCLMAIGMQLTTPNALGIALGGQEGSLTWLETVMATGVALATFWGIWLGVWIALKVLHKRGLSSVFSHDGMLRPSQFGAGALIAAGYLIVGVATGYFSGAAPVRTDLPLQTWLLSIAPLLVLMFFQTAGEELLFRGYLTQQLAAKIPHPLVWGLLPSLLFGLAHAGNTHGDVQFAVYYVLAATLLGLIMTAMVWRTGGLAAAMGFHLVNNIGAQLLFGGASPLPSLSLFTIDPGDQMLSAPTDLLILGLMLAFVLSPFAPLPKGQPLRRKDTRAVP